MCLNNWVHQFLKVVFVYSHITLCRYHHHAYLCILVWNRWTYKLPVIHCVFTNIIFSIILYKIWGCDFSAYRIFGWSLWEDMHYIIFIIKSELWILRHYLRLVNEPVACAQYISLTSNFNHGHWNDWWTFYMNPRGDVSRGGMYQWCLA